MIVIWIATEMNLNGCSSSGSDSGCTTRFCMSRCHYGCGCGCGCGCFLDFYSCCHLGCGSCLRFAHA
jgi:hypothetical protein